MRIHNIDYTVLGHLAKIAAGDGDYEGPGLSIRRKIGDNETITEGHFETNLGRVNFFIGIADQEEPEISFKVCDETYEIKKKIMLFENETDLEKIFIKNAKNIADFLFKILCHFNAAEAEKKAEAIHAADGNPFDLMDALHLASDLRHGVVTELPQETAMEPEFS